MDEDRPKKENYFKCEPCSKKQGEAVLYHRSTLKAREDLFEDDDALYCPEGHKVEVT